jgi:hypothetical protein
MYWQWAVMVWKVLLAMGGDDVINAMLLSLGNVVLINATGCVC